MCSIVSQFFYHDKPQCLGVTSLFGGAVTEQPMPGAFPFCTMSKYNDFKNHIAPYDALNELLNVKPNDWKEAYRIIRKFYLHSESLFNKRHSHFKAYRFPIWEWMNEAEREFYMTYRPIGGINLLPLYFVNGYYIDFANPFFKIGIEIDGKKFHDKEKDLKRDSDMAEFGWTIFRISASDVLKPQIWLSDIDSQFNYNTKEDMDELMGDFFCNYATGLLYALRLKYFDSISENSVYYNAVENALFKRTLVPDNLYNNG